MGTTAGAPVPPGDVAGRPPVLDDFIPAPDVRERFAIEIRAPADVVLAAARDLDMQSIGLVRAIFRLRTWITGSTATARRSQGLVAETLGLGWGVLRDVPDQLFVAGAACQPWLANVVFHPIPPGDFASYAVAGQVKIAWTLEATPIGPGFTSFVSETRAVATDSEARRKFRRYWRWARFGIIGIRLLLLPAIKRQVERR